MLNNEFSRVRCARERAIDMEEEIEEDEAPPTLCEFIVPIDSETVADLPSCEALLRCPYLRQELVV